VRGRRRIRLDPRGRLRRRPPPLFWLACASPRRPPAARRRAQRDTYAKEDLTLGKKLGSGAFGSVFLATLAPPGGGPPINAIVKKAKEYGAAEVRPISLPSCSRRRAFRPSPRPPLLPTARPHDPAGPSSSRAAPRSYCLRAASTAPARCT